MDSLLIGTSNQVTTRNLIKDESISISFNASYVNNLANQSAQVNFVAGGRMYMEVALVSSVTTYAGLSDPGYFKTFIDFYDFSPKEREKGHNNLTWLFVSIGIFVYVN
jgi:hypothetical protein